jgi:hypothetical protein
MYHLWFSLDYYFMECYTPRQEGECMMLGSHPMKMHGQSL